MGDYLLESGLRRVTAFTPDEEDRLNRLRDIPDDQTVFSVPVSPDKEYEQGTRDELIGAISAERNPQKRMILAQAYEQDFGVPAAGMLETSGQPERKRGRMTLSDLAGPASVSSGQSRRTTLADLAIDVAGYEQPATEEKDATYGDALKLGWERFKTSAEVPLNKAGLVSNEELARDVAADTALAASQRRPGYLKPIEEQVQRTNEAKGAGATAWEMAKLVGTAIVNPRATGYLFTENAANQVASLGGMAGGALAGAAVGGPVGALVGLAGGALIGNTPEYGAKVVEMIGQEAQKLGVDPTDPKNVMRILGDETFRSEAERQGLIKWGTISAVDAVTGGLVGRGLNAAERTYLAAQKSILARSGADIATAAANPAIRAELNAAKQAFMKTQTTGARATRGGFAAGAEMFSEGGGEFLGEGLASGEWKPGDATLEGILAMGQSVGEAVVTGKAFKPAAVMESIDGPTLAGKPLADFTTESLFSMTTSPSVSDAAKFKIETELLRRESADSAQPNPVDIQFAPGQPATPESSDAMQSQLAEQNAGRQEQIDTMGFADQQAELARRRQAQIDATAETSRVIPASKLLPAPSGVDFVAGDQGTGTPSQWQNFGLDQREAERKQSIAVGLLNHSRKPSPELLQRLMRVDATMATMLFNNWQNAGAAPTAAPITPSTEESPAALQDVPQAAPEAGALQGELTPGTPEYNAYFEKKAAAAQEKMDADQREQRRSEGQAAVDKKNSWRKKLIAWFDGAKDGDTITTNMDDDEYLVIEKTIDRSGKKIQSKRLVQVGGHGDGRNRTVIEYRDGQVYQGPNTNQAIDPSAGFAQAPETNADSIGAELGRAMEDGRAKVGASPPAIVNQQGDNNAPQTPQQKNPLPQSRPVVEGARQDVQESPQPAAAPVPDAAADNAGAARGAGVEKSAAPVAKTWADMVEADHQAPQIKPQAAKPTVQAYTQGQAKVTALRMTHQGMPSEAYPHPTEAGKWAIREVGEARETITPSEDKNIGANANSEPLYERKDGSVYRMHSGKPDFGGDLVPTELGEKIPPNSPDGVVVRDEAAFAGAPEALIKRLSKPKQRAMLMRGSNVPGGEFTLYEPGTRTHYSKDWKALQGESSAPDPVTVAMRYRTEADIVAMSQEAQSEVTGKAEAIAARQRADESERAIRKAAQAKDAVAREALRGSLDGAKFKRGKFQPKGDGKAKIEEVDAWIHGHLAVHKSFGHFKSGQEYTVSHSGTGFSVVSGFKSLASAKDAAARIERSAPMGELREAADIKKPEFDLFRKIGMAIKSSGGDPLAGAEFDAPAATNQDERSPTPVAESQAPATSEPGDAGVAPGRDGAAPDQSPSMADLNSGKAFVDSTKRKITEWVAQATNNGTRPMDRNWERSAVKRFVEAHIKAMLDGKQTGNRAAAKIAVSKSETFADLESAIEKFVTGEFQSKEMLGSSDVYAAPRIITNRTPAEVRAELSKHLGKTIIENLERKGLLKIVANAGSLPNGLTISETGTALYDGETAYLIADRSQPGESLTAILHEIGEHAGLETMLGAKGYQALKNRVKFMQKAGNVRVNQAYAFVAEAYPEYKVGSAEHFHEVLANIGQEADIQAKPWWKEMIAAVRRWLVQQGYGGLIRTKDIEDMVLHSLKMAARDQVRGATEIMPAMASKVGADATANGGMESRIIGDSGRTLEQLPGETYAQKQQRLWQDSMNRFKQAQELTEKNLGKAISDRANVYEAQIAMHGKISTQIEDFRELFEKPMIDKTAAAGFKMADVAAYLEAQHAPEANAKQREIHQDPDATANGVTDAEAAAEMAKFRAIPNFSEFKKIAEEWRGISDGTLDMLVAAGIIPQEQQAAYKAAYQHYVPLRGGEEDGAQTRPGGQKIKGKQKRRMGHGTRDEMVIENILKMRENAIKTVERNNVRGTMAQFLMEADNKEIGTVGKPVKRQVMKDDKTYTVQFNGSTVEAFHNLRDAQEHVKAEAMKYGRQKSEFKIVTEHDPMVALMASPMLADNEVNYYLNGNEIRLQLNDEILAQAATGLGTEQLGTMLSAARQFNTYLSKAYTGWNLEFAVVNPIRDFTAGMINLTGDYGLGMTAKIAKGYGRAVRELIKARKDPRLSADVIRYRKAGGSTGAAYLSDIERIGASAEAAYHEAIGARETYRIVYEQAIAAGKSEKQANAMALLKAGVAGFEHIPVIGHFIKLMERINAVTENALRLATFTTLVENGYSDQKAAVAAKDSSVNFNRKGELTSQAGALWLFFNPNVQGTARAIQSLMTSKHKNEARALVGMMALAAFALAEMARGGDDDDERKWKAIGNSVKNRNMIIRFGDTMITLPIPYGYGYFFSLGNAFSDMAHGGKASKVGINLANALMDNFSPIGTPIDDSGKFIPFQLLPTIPKMALAPQANQGGFGQPLMPIQYSGSKPDSQTMWRGTKGTIYSGIASGLNEATGGNKYAPGFVDVSPETLKFWVQSLTGGTGRFLSDSINLPIIMAQGATPDVREIPVVRKFVKEQSVADFRREFWDRANEAKTASEEYRAAIKGRDREAAKEIMDENRAVIAMAKQADRFAKMAKAKRDAEDAIRTDDSLNLAQKRERMKLIEAKEKAVYQRFLSNWESRVDR